MKAVSAHTHLYRRGAAYWFRRRVPQDIRRELQRVEWKEALGTKDCEEAKRLVRKRAVETDAEIAQARARRDAVASPPLAQADARALADGRFARWLQNDADGRLWDGRRTYENVEIELDSPGLRARR